MQEPKDEAEREAVSEWIGDWADWLARRDTIVVVSDEWSFEDEPPVLGIAIDGRPGHDWRSTVRFYDEVHEEWITV